jgi:seryl-tRNA synthetase
MAAGYIPELEKSWDKLGEKHVALENRHTELETQVKKLVKANKKQEKTLTNMQTDYINYVDENQQLKEKVGALEKTMEEMKKEYETQLLTFMGVIQEQLKTLKTEHGVY